MSQSKITSKRNFPEFNIVLSSSFSLTSPAFGMPTLVHAHGNISVWALLDNSQDL